MAGARGLALKRPSAIPGFGLALGFTLTYLSLIVLIPLGGLVLKSATLGLAGFLEVVTGPRTLAALRPGAVVLLHERPGTIAAVDRLKEAGAKSIRMACLLASPEGISKFRGYHPDVHIWTAAVDTRLNDHGYILPGLGDAGDRMYGTR